MPFKDFNIGDILTSSDVDTYLMSQVIIRCTSTTRPPSPAEGWHIYETDTQRLMTYRSGSWQLYVPLQTTVIKAANESVTNSTAMQDDDHLFLPVSANADYMVEAYLIYTGISTGHLMLGWSAPAGATLNWTPNGVTGGGTVGSIDRSNYDVASLGFAHVVSATIKAAAMPKGLLRTAGTSGTLRLRWTQANVQATATTVYANSFLRLTRLA